MRQLSQAIKTYSVTLGASTLAQSAKQIPNYGSVQGFDWSFTVTLAGATASETSHTIDRVIDSISLETNKGKTIANLDGTDLSYINDVLSPIGHRTSSLGVVTDSNGNGSQTFNMFLPYTISAADMPAVVKVTFAAKSALENATLTSAGTATAVWELRASYSTQKLDTLFVKASNPPVGSGENALAPYLPQGMEVRALMVSTLPDYGGELNYITLLQDGAALLSRQPAWSFANDDDALDVSDHLGGQYILRVPVFTVNSTTVLDVDLKKSGVPVRLYSFATRPQKNTSGN
jgi:hypothetical protein